MSGLLSRLSACYLQAASLPLVARATRESVACCPKPPWTFLPVPSYRPGRQPWGQHQGSISKCAHPFLLYHTHTYSFTSFVREKPGDWQSLHATIPGRTCGISTTNLFKWMQLIFLFLCFHQRRHDVALVAPIRDACLCTVLNYWRHLPLQPIVIFVKYFWQFVWS